MILYYLQHSYGSEIVIHYSNAAVMSEGENESGEIDVAADGVVAEARTVVVVVQIGRQVFGH